MIRTPDTGCLSLHEPADERRILIGYLAWAAKDPAARRSYRMFRRGYETAHDWELPPPWARDPATLRRALRSQARILLEKIRRQLRSP